MRGIDVTLYAKSTTSVDEFGAPIYTEVPITVHNVLIGEPSTDEITDTLSLYGKRLAYTLAIPKGDTNTWTDRDVEFFGERFRTIGEPTMGIDHLIPLSWNKKVKVERYG